MKNTIYEDIRSDISSCLDGDIDKAISFLEQIRDENKDKYEKIIISVGTETDYDDPEAVVTITGVREETDEEEAMRERKLGWERDRKAIEERRQYEELKKKFEGGKE